MLYVEGVLLGGLFDVLRLWWGVCFCVSVFVAFVCLIFVVCVCFFVVRLGWMCWGAV